MSEKLPKVATISLGCVKNLINTEFFLGKLVEEGFVLAQDPRDADVVLVNTCAFIDSAVQESLETLRYLVELEYEEQPRKVIAVGCMAQRFGSELMEAVPGLAGAVGLDQESGLPRIIRTIANGGRVFPQAGPAQAAVKAGIPRLRLTPRHYAYLQVSEGCNANCTFCTIPEIRGPLRSKTQENILEEARELVGSGAKELILVAQDLTAYGEDSQDGRSLTELLSELEGIEDLVWIRLLYLHPNKVGDALIEKAAQSTKILPVFDLPFQHAAPRVLKRMGRSAGEEGVEGVVRRIRERVDPVVLRGTFLTGFPGEKGSEFEQLAQFAKKECFPRGGVFRFNPQPGTAADRLGKRVKPAVAKRRAERLKDIIAENALRFAERAVGTKREVLVDGPKEGFLSARSFSEAPDVDPVVRLPLGSAEPGSFVKVGISGVEGLDMVGEPCSGNV